MTSLQISYLMKEQETKKELESKKEIPISLKPVKNGMLLNESILFMNIPTGLVNVTTQYYSHYENFIKLNDKSNCDHKFENELTNKCGNYSIKIITKEDAYYVQLLTTSYTKQDSELLVEPCKHICLSKLNDDESVKLINSFINMIYPLIPYGDVYHYYCRHANTHEIYKANYNQRKIIIGGLVYEQRLILNQDLKTFSIDKTEIKPGYEDIIMQLLFKNREEIKNRFYKSRDVKENMVVF